MSAAEISAMSVQPADDNSADEWAYKCDECGKGYPTIRDLAAHKGVHSGECPYVCEYCHKGYKNKMNLMNHINLHIGEGYTCHICSKVYSSAFLLKQHARLHVQEKQFACEICDKTFKIAEFLHGHMQQVHSETGYSCPKCPLKLRSEKSLEAHLKKHALQKVLCPYCGISYKSNLTLKRHLVKHKVTADKMLPCPHCGEKFLYKDTLAYHCSRFHSATVKHECIYCNRELKSSEALASHIRQHRKTKPDRCLYCGGFLLRKHRHRLRNRQMPLSCPLCAAKFSCPAKLLKHAHVHGDDPKKLRWCCKTCGCYFLCRREYKQHMVRPHITTPGLVSTKFPCASCKDIFSTSETLREHVKVHVKDRKNDNSLDLLCQDCGKMCNSLTGLHRHRRQHISTNSYPCLYCSDVFKDSYPLKKHMEVHFRHNGAHQCHMCDLRFLKKASCALHMEFHRQNGEDVCMKCLVAFPNYEQYTAHLESHSLPPKCSMCDEQFRNTELLENHVIEQHDCAKLFACGRCNLGLTNEEELKMHEDGHIRKEASNAKKMKSMLRGSHAVQQVLPNNKDDASKLRTYCPCARCKTCPICKKNHSFRCTASSQKSGCVPLPDAETLQHLLKKAKVRKVNLRLPPQKTSSLPLTPQVIAQPSSVTLQPESVTLEMLEMTPHYEFVTCIASSLGINETSSETPNLSILPDLVDDGDNDTATNDQLVRDTQLLNMFCDLLVRILGDSAFTNLKSAAMEDVRELLQSLLPDLDVEETKLSTEDLVWHVVQSMVHLHKEGDLDSTVDNELNCRDCKTLVEDMLRCLSANSSEDDCESHY